MNAEKYLQQIGLENIIGEQFFNNDDKSYYTVQELMESYHSQKQIVDIVEDVSHVKCVHLHEHILTVKTIKLKCKHCGDEKWEEL